MSGQGDLFGDKTVPARATDTSQQAAKSIAGSVVRYRALVLQAIRDAGPVNLETKQGGLTADEAAEKLKLGILTVRPRCSELKDMNLIKDSCHRRPSSTSGSPMIVWEVVDD
jgi:hypothetical protein